MQRSQAVRARGAYICPFTEQLHSSVSTIQPWQDLVIDIDATPLDLVLVTLEVESAEDAVIDIEGLGGLPSLSRRFEQPHRRALRLRLALLDSICRRFRCHRTCACALRRARAAPDPRLPLSETTDPTAPNLCYGV